MNKIIIKIKPLYRAIKNFQRNWRGFGGTPKGVSGEELDFLLAHAKQDGKFLEVGTAFGETTKALAKKGYVITMDPYIADENGLIMGYYKEDIIQEMFKNIEGKTVSFYPLKSEDVYEILRNDIWKRFDFIFIDGIHTYEDVKKDYRWAKALKEDGLIAFHDTHMPEINKFIKKYPDKEMKLFATYGSTKIYKRKEEKWIT